MPFEFEKLSIDGVILIKSKIFDDNRGFFIESYKKSDFIKNGIDMEFVQENYSSSNARVLRGLHYQVSPHLQSKLIRCTVGKINDILVDLRPSSKTFKKWLRIELSQENGYMLFVPEGLAHGFVVLSENAQLSYKTNKEYAPESERGLLWCDDEINVDWDIDFEPILSEKDKNQSAFKNINQEELL